ncbi:MAG: alpha/beta hydrolase [Candidatus Dojkabacteria bacterium]|nr:MAG: alpha/beta hydrolase [Candidatus Dojkabacteria bacterium]
MKIDVDGLKINYLESEGAVGSQVPILFVHGWGGSVESLRGLFSTASKYRYKAYLLDLPGFGNSDAPTTTWGVEEYALFLRKFIVALGLHEVIYFGHSFGGGLGAYISAESPDLIKNLILCAAAIRRSPKESKASSTIKKVVPNYEQYKEKARPLRKLYYKIFYPLSDTLKNPKLEESYRKIITQDLTDRLEKINKPTLILWGDQDRYTPVEEAVMINEKISGSKIKIYQGVGHSLPISQPENIFIEIDNFIRQNR